MIYLVYGAPEKRNPCVYSKTKAKHINLPRRLKSLAFSSCQRTRSKQDNLFYGFENTNMATLRSCTKKPGSKQKKGKERKAGQPSKKISKQAKHYKSNKQKRDGRLMPAPTRRRQKAFETKNSNSKQKSRGILEKKQEDSTASTKGPEPKLK